jgi:hypothetical protein
MSLRRSRSRGRGEFVAVEDHQNLGVLSEEEDGLRKRAYKTVKQGFASYKEDYDAVINIMPADEWDIDKKRNFLYIPFKITPFPSCGEFELYFQRKFDDRRAVVAYDGDDRFIMKVDWERLLAQENSTFALLRRYRKHRLGVLGVLLALWFWFIWLSLRTPSKE